MRICRWIKVVPRPHECYPPRKVKYKYWVGSHWECSCGMVWKIVDVKEGYDNEYRWREVNG